jgi:acetyltransferase-like isoleucine patch superfamily enzyme
VTIGPRTHVSYGAVIEAYGTPVRIGAEYVVRENLNIRSTHRNAVEIGNHVLIGPHASIFHCGEAIKEQAIREHAAPRRHHRRCRSSRNPRAAAVLVRPDGHVAWRGRIPPADPLALIDRLRGA